MKHFSILLLFIIFIANKAIAQTALDNKNGFRDAKFGMPISAFKGMKRDKSTDGITELKFYTRATDIKKLGDIPLNSITYTFNKVDRLMSILITADEQYGEDILETLNSAYGKGWHCTWCTAKGEWYMWNGNSVRLNVNLANYVSIEFITKNESILLPVVLTQEQKMQKRKASL